MTKSQKHKKTRVADFSKAKLKLGKGKKPANNATDTTFKARSIALPVQTIAANQDDAEPTTRRNLTLADLMIQVKHYSVNTKKDALIGMRELLEAHPELISPNLNAIIHSTARTIGDEDSGVRKILLQLYSVIFALVPTQVLIPHAAPVVLHATSALSHIFREIRIDSIGFLDLLMEHSPQAFLRGQQRALDGYLSLLNLRGRSAGQSDQGPSLQSSGGLALSTTSKLIILRSMARFLKITLVGMTNVSDTDEIRSLRQIPTWFFRPSFLTDDAYHRFVKSISTVISPFPRTVQWQPTRSDLAEEDGIEENAAGWTSTHDLTSLCNSSQVSWMLEDLEEDRKRDGPIALLENGLNVVLALSGVIHPLLVSTFLDVSGSVAMPSRGGGDGGETEVELLWTVTELASLVFGPIIRSDDTVVPSASRLAAQAQLKLVLVRMTTHFPFGSDASIRRDNKSEGLLNQLNILICELSSLVLLRIGDPENERVSRIDRWSETNAGQVTDWVIKVLRGQIVTGVHPMGQNLSASGYAALLPTIWSLVNDMQGGRRTEQTDITPQQRRVWDAVVDHGTKTSTTSTVKKLAVEFIGRVYALQSDRQYIGSFRLQRHEIQPWLIALPQLLWEIGTLDAICSETILRLLLLAVQRGALEDATAKAISSRLEPYWTVMHRTRGPIAGPWMRLNRQSTVRRLAVDLAMSLRTQYGMNPEDGLYRAVTEALRADSS